MGINVSNCQLEVPIKSLTCPTVQSLNLPVVTRLPVKFFLKVHCALFFFWFVDKSSRIFWESVQGNCCSLAPLPTLGLINNIWHFIIGFAIAFQRSIASSLFCRHRNSCHQAEHWYSTNTGNYSPRCITAQPQNASASQLIINGAFGINFLSPKKSLTRRTWMSNYLILHLA